jgi:Domain of unknown function (DUF4224)
MTATFLTPSIRLTPIELKELVGSTHKKKQIEWLGQRGWRFDLDINGRPIVIRSFLEARLGVTNTNTRTEKTDARPRFELIAA